MKTIEVESKYEVSEEDFVKIRERGRIKELKEQLNIYFDYQNCLSSQAITFRIRLTNNSRPKMTLKIPHEIQFTQRKAIEIEKELEIDSRLLQSSIIDVEKDLPAEFKKHLQFYNLKKLRRIGEMKTNRWVTRLDQNIEVELDQVRLPNGKIFFEVEIENDKYRYRQRAESLLKSISSNLIPSKCSKYERFSHAILNLEVHRPETA